MVYLKIHFCSVENFQVKLSMGSYVRTSCSKNFHGTFGLMYNVSTHLRIIGQYTGNITKPRYFCHTEYNLEIP